jgi:hypothetical protein
MRKDKKVGENEDIQSISKVFYGQKEELDKIDQILDDISKKGMKQEDKLDALFAQVEELCDDTGVVLSNRYNVKHSAKDEKDIEPPIPTSDISWDSLVESYSEIDVNFDASLDDLLPPEVVAQIENNFDSPLSREPWDKWGDYLIVVVAGLTGAIFDLLLNHKFLDREDIHKNISHPKHSIDFHGVGGNKHRIVGAGHDLFRFNEARQMLIDGEFRAKYGGSEIISRVFKYNGDLKVFDIIPADQATNALLTHWFADFFSKRSLPIPGFSYLNQNEGRLFEFVKKSYENGLNLRSVLSNLSGVVLTEIIMTLYLMINRFRKDVPKWYRLSKNPKHHEMYLLSHTINMAVNVGKIVVTKNVFAINVPAIMAIIKHLFPVIADFRRRYSSKNIFIRNKEILDGNWDNIEQYVSRDIGEHQIITNFLSGPPIHV